MTRLTEENTELVSDNSYFYRICQNLLENALKYSAKGTRIFVTTYIRRKDSKRRPDAGESVCGDYKYISVSHGFYKGRYRGAVRKRDKARSSEGNGLGLAIVSTYAKALGGEFDIKIDCDQFKACVMMPVEVR